MVTGLKSPIIKMRFYLLRFALLATTAFFFSSHGEASDSCLSGFTLCAPAGATSETTPQIGTPAFQTLFVDILSSSLPTSSKISSSAPLASLCCASSMSCLLMAGLRIPFCYDRFTTDYYLPDGSYGTVVGGIYNSSSGDLANLISGQYSLVNGSTGNIYTNGSAPNTALLPMPSQYTASGIGPAIPASALGNEITITYITTFPGTTIPPSTIPPSTISAIVTPETMIVESTISTEVLGSMLVTSSVEEMTSSSTLPGTTISGTTIPGKTIHPLVATITTTELVPEVSSTAGAKKNGSISRKGTHSHLVGALGSILVIFLQRNY